MVRWSGILTLWLLLWPPAGYAADVDVPQLGIRFAALPPGSSAPQVAQVPGGFELTVQLGSASLRALRENDAAPAGSDVASPGYRATLDARYGHHVDSTDQGAPTAVGGRSAWTVVEVRRAHGQGRSAYTCVTYVVVDQHLYRLAVDAAGERRPPEFDQLVRALSGITFESVRRS